MTCHEVDARIEAIVAGDDPGDERLRLHVDACPRCAAAFAAAIEIEAVLAERQAPVAPEQFATEVTARIREANWQSEERVDRVFNLLLAAAVVLVLAGGAALMNLSAVTSVAGRAIDFLSRPAHGAGEPLPTFGTYVMGSGFVASALLVWWWAERRLSA